MLNKVNFRQALFLCAILLLLPAWVCGGEKSPEEIFLTAGNFIAAGDYEKAVTELSKIPAPEKGEDAGNYVKSLMQSANLLHALGDLDRAESFCRKVLAIYPDNTEAGNFLASLEQEKLPFYVLFFRDLTKFLPSLLKGTLMTLLIVLCTVVISPIGGLLVAVGRVSGIRFLSGLCWFFIWFFRGTPLLLQLFFIYYGLPAFGITLSPLSAAVLGMGLNYSAYLAEIIRAGILSIDDGQMEAAKAIGMGYGQAMRRIIIPQTYKRLMPPIGNEFIALIKDTALVSTIAMVELMRSADQLFNTYFNINVLIIAALIYLLLTTVFTLLFEHVEKRVGAYENR